MTGKTFFLFFAAALLAGCSPQRNYTGGGDGRTRSYWSHIVVDTDRTGEVFFLISGYREATIDWGDGTPPQTVALRPIPYSLQEMYQKNLWKVSHVYAKEGSKKIQISGNVTAFFPKGLDPLLSAEEWRARYFEYAKVDSVLMPVAGDDNETITVNGRTYPIVGYGYGGDPGRTVVSVSIAARKEFVGVNGGSLSQEIEGTVTVNGGPYAGTWNTIYVYTSETWMYQHFNVYIDSPWKGTRMEPADEINVEADEATFIEMDNIQSE